MNLAYYRKSAKSVDEAVAALKAGAERAGLKVLGEVELPENAGKTVLVCRPDWLKKVLDVDRDLAGFLPCGILALSKKGETFVGTGHVAIIRSLNQHPELAKLAAEADKTVRQLINEAAGVGELKPKAVKLYSTMSCPYCKLEKSWLDDKKIKHEVVYVDLNQAEAEVMVEKTGQMGVPVTEIQYEDAESEYIVGFDKPRLEQILSA